MRPVHPHRRRTSWTLWLLVALVAGLIALAVGASLYLPVFNLVNVIQ